LKDEVLSARFNDAFDLFTKLEKLLLDEKESPTQIFADPAHLRRDDEGAGRSDGATARQGGRDKQSTIKAAMKQKRAR
jgi:hypothetical protein